ncbi:phage holin family protein [Bordetella bronchiseptica]|uniref:phage holin family protein n=1 Tax=Bordetella bronchiseptica TaxID=518 RepID=UPI0009B83A5C
MIAFVIVLANFLTAGRLICWRRGACRYRPGVSVLAYLLIVASGGQAIDVAIGGAPGNLWQAVFSMIVCAIVWRSRGNVAAMGRPGVWS